VNYLSRVAVAKRYGVHKSTIARWERDETLRFPAPEIIRNRLYFSVPELVAFEATPKGRRAAFKQRYVFKHPAWLPRTRAGWAAFYDRLNRQVREEELRDFPWAA
jgi:transcriptional regulator with XRE-family HTH domain